VAKTERISVRVRGHRIEHLAIVALRVTPVDLGDVDRQRTVHEDVHGRKVSVLPQLIQPIHELLSAPHRKRGNEQFSTRLARGLGVVEQVFASLRWWLMLPVTVGALHDDVIGVPRYLRVAQDR